MDRKDYILGILRLAKELNVEVTATRFQKTIFLVQKELGRELGYNFIPYYFGPYSRELQDDVYRLERQGFVNVEEVAVEDLVTGTLVGFKKVYKITDKAPVVELDQKLKSFVTEKLIMPLHDLLRYVYVKYPEYTATSLTKDKIF